MERYAEFVGNHWILSSLWILLLLALIFHQRRRGGRSLSHHEATLLVNRSDGIMLDVRDRKDFDKGHIVNSRNIPLSELSGSLRELDSHKEKPLIVVDAMGQHAGEAVKLLQKAGFTQVSRLQGGMGEWRASSLPVVSKGGK